MAKFILGEGFRTIKINTCNECPFFSKINGKCCNYPEIGVGYFHNCDTEKAVQKDCPLKSEVFKLELAV